jgi:hypothetical protein
MEWLDAHETLEQLQPLQSTMVRFVRFVSAVGEPIEPSAHTDKAGWRCDRNQGESAADHRARAAGELEVRCTGRVVLFECWG